MKKIIQTPVLFILFSSILIAAEKPTLEIHDNFYLPTNPMIIKAETCREVEQAVKDILSSKSPHVKTCSPYISGNKQGMCQAEVSQCFTQELRTRHQSDTFIPGPNCWNFALYSVGLKKYLTHSSPQEISYYTENFCKPVKKQNLQGGEIGRVKNQKGEEVHAFHVIKGDLIYEKHGENLGTEYFLQTREAMLDQYGKTRYCQQRNSSNSECYNRTKYYRCSKSMNDILKNLEKKRPRLFRHFIKIWNELDKFAKNFSPIIHDSKFNYIRTNKNVRKKALKIYDQALYQMRFIKDMVSALPKPLTKENLKSHSNTLQDILGMRFHSLGHQLWKFSQRTTSWEKKYERNTRDLKGIVNDISDKYYPKDR